MLRIYSQTCSGVASQPFHELQSDNRSGRTMGLDERMIDAEKYYVYLLENSAYEPRTMLLRWTKLAELSAFCNNYTVDK